jgi:transcriptional regulatory protein RtcR
VTFVCFAIKQRSLDRGIEQGADRLQLESVLKVCSTAASQAEAGRKLFSQSRSAKASPNDSDRIRKFLARFNIPWSQVSELV